MSQSLFFMLPYDWANSMVVLAGVFFGGGEYGFSTVEVSVILQNGCGIQGPDFLDFLQESEMEVGYRCRNWTLCVCFGWTTV